MVELSARKNDEGKLRYDLIPPIPLEELVYVYTEGAKKYDDWNWRLGTKWSRIYAAAMRHLQAWWSSQADRDPENGQHPLASVAWCMLTLMEYDHFSIGTDDRPCNLTVMIEPDDGTEGDDIDSDYDEFMAQNLPSNTLREGTYEEYLDAIATAQYNLDKGRMRGGY